MREAGNKWWKVCTSDTRTRSSHMIASAFTLKCQESASPENKGGTEELDVK